MIFCFFLVSLVCQSQSSLEEFIHTAGPSARADFALTRLDKTIRTIQSGNLGEEQKLRQVFHKLHRSYLRKYIPYSSFGEIFTRGRFDCLTGTALFTYVLDRLHFRYDIIETNYHIFIMVHTTGGDILLETTDRFGGFVTDPARIAQRTSDYRQNLTAGTNASLRQYKYSFELFQTISTRQVTGLLYFNQAVKAFNSHDWITSTKMLREAMRYYPSARCEELNSLLSRTILSVQMDDLTRQECLELLVASDRHPAGLWATR